MSIKSSLVISLAFQAFCPSFSQKKRGESTGENILICEPYNFQSFSDVLPLKKMPGKLSSLGNCFSSTLAKLTLNLKRVCHKF